MDLLRSEYVDGVDFHLPITMHKDGDEFVISVDGVEWVRVKNAVHAAVLFAMMMENIADYVTYEKK